MSVFLLNWIIISVGHSGATRNCCSLGAPFGGSFGMGRGCRTRLRLRHSSPFPAHSLIALAPHSAKRSHAIPDGLKLFRARKSTNMLSGMMLSYSAWPGISVIMSQIQIPFSFPSLWHCIVEQKNGCFIAWWCLNRFKMNKFCFVEQKNECIFTQLNNYWRRPFGAPLGIGAH